MSLPLDEQNGLERLAQKIVPGCKLLRAWPLSGGISAQMTALEAAPPGGQARKMVLRQISQSPAGKELAAAVETEYRILESVHRLGLAAPAPLLFHPGDEIFPSPCFVMEFIEGSPQYAPPDRANFAYQAAEHLVRIHGANFESLDVTFLPQAPAECPEMLRKTSTGLDHTLHEEEIRLAIQSVLPVPRRNKSVLLHGDYWPGNLLWHNGNLAAVVDWEDAMLGDPLIDLSISRLDLMWILGEETMRAFTVHYQSRMTIDVTCLPYWDLCAALRLIRLAGANLAEWAAFFHPYGRFDITEQTIREHLNSFVRQALEQLPRCRTNGPSNLT